ncbi:Carboxypeptidase_A [Hexamita inflata]|uniref:Carboxypeptidase domain n=1 Tax=Hexamita inflata TaxID=28002 RepID=A0AA86UI68_9EUKA|nr:Carboxypeptidase A [Hexamita inflata]
MFHVFNCRRLLRSSVALGFAFLHCSHTLEAWRRSRCPSSGSFTVSLTLLRRDGAFMHHAGVMQLGFFVNAYKAVFAQEGVRLFIVILQSFL